jgi:hypothetical protein
MVTIVLKSGTKYKGEVYKENDKTIYIMTKTVCNTPYDHHAVGGIYEDHPEPCVQNLGVPICKEDIEDIIYE